jgi:hypothetical protein
MNSSFITVLGLSVLAASVCGCVATKPLPPGLHTESKSAGGVKVLGVGLVHDNAGLLVHGRVERMLGYPDSPFRHLDLEVIGPAGELLSRRAIRFFPNPIPFSRFGPGRSTYTARLNEIPLSGSTIRVMVDCTLLSKCPLASADER